MWYNIGNIPDGYTEDVILTKLTVFQLQEPPAIIFYYATNCVFAALQCKEQLDIVAPKVIIALGATAVESLLEARVKA